MTASRYVPPALRPLEAAKASYGRYVDRAELEELVRALPPTFDERSIPGLTYRPW